MPSSRFLMDHGAGYTSHLWRHEIARDVWVWRDEPPGTRKTADTLQLDDIDGHPVDDFGLPIFGKFIDVDKNS